MTLELAGLCVGVLDPARAVFARRPEPDALVELARHPSAIAHEVANPLTAALANLDECLETVRHEEARDERSEGLLRNLSGVEEGLQQAVGFLRSIQNRARDAFALEERFDAVRVVNSCVALERPLARKSGSSLTVYSMPEPVFLRGDPNGLYRILTNLVRNAVHASAGHDDGVSVALERAHGSLQLVVRDRGAGIAPELLERIFEPGFTTKSIGAGSGMGLAIAKEIAEQVFGGTIRVESAVGQGSVFTVILPLPPQRTSPPG
jgi:signal transduction histidine kinase